VKAVDDKTLKETKVSDLPGYIKRGNLDMVAGLVTYYRLSSRIVNIQIPADEYIFTNGEKFITSDWNPLLYAVANK
jgi:hypothetical protein